MLSPLQFRSSQWLKVDADQREKRDEVCPGVGSWATAIPAMLNLDISDKLAIRNALINASADSTPKGRRFDGVQ